MESEILNNVMSGMVSYNNQQYVSSHNNFILPKIICSIATNTGKEDFDLNKSVSAFGYNDIKILKSKASMPLSDESKNIFGLIIHQSILNKSYVVNLDIFETLKILGWKDTTVNKHKSTGVQKITDGLNELRSFTISCRIKNKIIIAGLVLNSTIDLESNNLQVIIDPTFFELHNNDLFHLAGDSKKINSNKGDSANIIYKILLSNNYNPWSFNSILLKDLLYALQLNCSNTKNEMRTCKRALDSLVNSGKLSSYEIKKVGFNKELVFKLNKFDINGCQIKKENVVAEDKTQKPATAPQAEVEVENFSDHEPVPEKKEVNATTEIPFDLFDDDLPF